MKPSDASSKNVERREGHFTGHKGTELFHQAWLAPQKNAKTGGATLVITHGIGEHSECYVKTAENLAQLGWNVCAWDLRGHGRSEGKRGFVEDFHFYSLDLGHYLKFLRENGRLGEKFALLGHSMGGLITLRHILDEDKSVPTPKALALSSPLLGFTIAVPPIKDFAARVLHRVLPTVTLFNELKYEDLTRDPEHLKTYAQDPLRHDKISPAVYLGMIANIELAKQKAAKIQLPVIIQAGGQERIVNLPAIKEFYAAVGSAKKKLTVYEDSCHEVYNDLDRLQAIQELDAFLSDTIQ